MATNDKSAREGCWKRRLLLCGLAVVIFVREVLYFGLSVGAGALAVWRIPTVQTWVMSNMLRIGLDRAPAEPPVASPRSEHSARLSTDARAIVTARELFVATNVWDVHFKFCEEEWSRLTPERIPPLPRVFNSDGTVVLRNPRASRNGLAGVLGIHLPWSTCDLVFGNVVFSNVAVRFKGNGTFVTSQQTYKRPFKVNLGKGHASTNLAGRSILNFHNLIADGSFLSDTLGYAFYREAGLPAPRTTFARVCLTLHGKFENRLLGLYLIVENPDTEWAEERLGIHGVALFKPVTCELFKYLGDDWSAYSGIYDPKTKLEPWHERRVIELAKLLTLADHQTFLERIGDFVDIDQFARFLACEVLLANYDGILSTGQNFVLYLDPYAGRFGFIPWDLDHSWGEFPLLGTFEQRACASIWRPWSGENRFLERMFTVPAFRERYRTHLAELRKTVFVPEVLGRWVDFYAAIIRPFVAEESQGKLARFEAIVSEPPSGAAFGNVGQQQPWLAHNYKRFFAMRAKSIDAQLAGLPTGIVLRRDVAR